MLDKKKMLHDMSARMANLQLMIDKDISGNTQAMLEAWREVKYWKESIERNTYNIRIWGDDE